MKEMRDEKKVDLIVDVKKSDTNKQMGQMQWQCIKINVTNAV